MQPTIAILDPKGSGEMRLINLADYDRDPRRFVLWSQYQADLKAEEERVKAKPPRRRPQKGRSKV